MIQQWTGLEGQISSIDLEVPDPKKDFVEKQLEQMLRSKPVYLERALKDESDIARGTEEIYQGLYLVGVLGLLMSSVILFGTLYVSFTERKKEIAVMKALGYTQGQTVRLLLIEVLILSLTGTFIGALLGIWISRGLTRGLFQTFDLQSEPSPDLFIPALITVLAGLAISLLTTLLPVIQASRTPVTLVLKNEQPLYSKNRQSIAAVLGLLCAAAGLVLPYPAKAILLFIGIILTFPTLITFAVRVFSPVVRCLFGQEWILAAANTLRKPVRSSSAAFLLCVAVSLLVLVNSVGAAFKQHVMDSTRSLLGGDVAFATSTPLEQKDLERIRKIPGVDRVNVFRQANILWKNHGKKRSILILGVPTDDRQAFPLFISPGKPVRPILEKLREPQTAVLGQGLYDKWGGRIGENIQFKTSTGTRSFKVVGTLFPERQRKCGLYVRRVVFGHRHPIRQGRRNPG
jgi:putative ABC transport system permease protein